MQKKTSCLQNGDSRLIAPCLLYQRCSGIYLYSAKGDILIAPGRSSDSWSLYFLHLPNKLLVAICRFRHTYSGGTVVEFHNLPFYFLKANHNC